MQKLHFSIVIHAPKEKVWNAMLGDATYRQWAAEFAAGSYFEGSWDEGADIRFLALNQDGVLEGIASRIKENRLYEFVSIEHRGMVLDGKVDMFNEAMKEWAGALENYTFQEKDGGTEVLVDTDTEEKYSKMFQDMWPKALGKLKEIAEKSTAETAVAVTVEALVKAPLQKVWECWTDPSHIMQWCHASDDWEAPHAENDARTGGKFKTVMAAKDKSVSFDFEGVYSHVKNLELIEYGMADGRQVKVQFTEGSDGVKVTETFDIEHTNSAEMQRAGWQAILDNFKKHVEAQG